MLLAMQAGFCAPSNSEICRIVIHNAVQVQIVILGVMVKQQFKENLAKEGS